MTPLLQGPEGLFMSAVESVILFFSNCLSANLAYLQHWADASALLLAFGRRKSASPKLNWKDSQLWKHTFFSSGGVSDKTDVHVHVS